MKAVQISEADWFIPERGGKFEVIPQNKTVSYSEASGEGGTSLYFNTDDLPAFLRRCGYTLAWLDGRVDVQEGSEDYLTMRAIEQAEATTKAVEESQKMQKAATNGLYQNMMSIIEDLNERLRELEKEAPTIQENQTVAEALAAERERMLELVELCAERRNGVATNDFIHIDVARGIIKGGDA